MKRALTGLLAALVLLSGCSTMKPQDFAKTEPNLVIEEYFAGYTKAWGIFEDRFGTLRREFVVDIDGVWNPDTRTLVLTEDFLYSDGETERRVWTIVKLDDNRYQGTAADVIGTAEGLAFGKALNWRYDFNLKVGDSRWAVHFDDWMFLQDKDTLINRARVSKLGVEIGEATLFFRKMPKQVAATGTPDRDAAEAAPTAEDSRERIAS